jgi:hypothetical protein
MIHKIQLGSGVMENVWVLASVWVGLALVATLLAIWFKISTALTEIVVGTVAQLIIGAFIVQGGLGESAKAVRSQRCLGAEDWPSGTFNESRSAMRFPSPM